MRPALRFRRGGARLLPCRLLEPAQAVSSARNAG
jgi:hypothetical protein